MRNVCLRSAGAGFVLLFLGAIGAWAQSDAKDLYLDKCAACHGPDGAGQTAKGKKLKMKSAKETTAKMSAADMMAIVAMGKGADMDAYAKQLSQDQIKSVVDYYRSLGK
jgi:mono/diheme cytochrome c family protein